MKSTYARLGWTCILVAFVGCAAITPENSKQAARQRWDKVRGRIKLQLAQEQFTAGHIDEAHARLREALGLDPTEPQAHILLAKICIEKGELVAARTALETAQASGETAEIDYLAGVVAQRYGNFDEALRSYSLAAGLAPQNPSYLVAQAEMLVATGHPEEALNLILERRIDFERHAPMRALLGDLYVMQNEFSLASEAYREASRLAPEDMQLKIQLGIALSRAGNYQEAIGILASCVRTNPKTSWPAYLALGRAYLESGNVAAARDTFREAVRIRPSDAEPWLWLARSALINKDFIGAREATEKVVSLTPNDASAWLLLGYICREQKEYSRSLNAFETAVRLDPADPLAHCLIGQIYETTGNRTKAVAYFEKAVQMNPADEWAHALLAAADGKNKE